MNTRDAIKVRIIELQAEREALLSFSLFGNEEIEQKRQLWIIDRKVTRLAEALDAIREGRDI